MPLGAAAVAASMPIMKATEQTDVNESSYLCNGGVFDLAIVSLVGAGAVGLCAALAISLWVAVVCVTVLQLRLRSHSRAQFPRARSVKGVSR
jgi:threonine dehydrogenase-like Zn-dependent dehydrogenase